MNREDYVAAAIRTAPHLTRDSDSFILGGIGVAGEAIETFEALHEFQIDKSKVVKELGDVTWYMALLSFVHDIYFPGLFIPNELAAIRAKNVFGNEWQQILEHGKNTLFAAKNVSEFAKKAVFHNHPVDVGELELLLTKLAQHVQYTAVLADATIEEVLNKNIDKLKVRYPERFTTEGSLNKNEEVE